MEPLFETDRFTAYTFAERPDLVEKVRTLDSALPEFMSHDHIDNLYWHRLYEEFAEFQIAILQGEEPVAAGYTIPVSFEIEELPDRGWDTALESGFKDLRDKKFPTILCALLALVDPALRGNGISRVVLEAMKKLALKCGLSALIAPVRPSMKSLYPLTPIENYIRWRREDGLLFDPWMRAHERCGAQTIKVATRSMEIKGSVSDWESWTKLHFPESGSYIIEGALVPIEINVEKDIAVYTEPNVWMLHEPDGKCPK